MKVHLIGDKIKALFGRRVVPIKNARGDTGVFVETRGKKTTIHVTEGKADASTVLNASLVVFARTLTEQDRQIFAAWTELPAHWSAEHDHMFCEAFAHVAWESDNPVFLQVRSLVDRPGQPLGKPLSHDARRVIERMLGA